MIEFYKNKRLPLLILFTTILLTSSFSAVCATTSTNDKKETLPEFLENFLVKSLPKVSEEELDRIRTLWIKQIALNKEHEPEAQEIIKNYETSGTKTFPYYLSEYLDYEIFGGAAVYNGVNMEGTTDSYYARFLCPWDNSGASIVGSVSENDEWLHYCYIRAKLGPTGAGKNGNYFTVFGNFTPELGDDGWWDHFIGYGQVTSSSWQSVYIGVWDLPYTYIAVGTVAMGGNCTYNDVLGDCVIIV